MAGFSSALISFQRASLRAYAHRTSFVFLFLFVFLATLDLLGQLGWVPNPVPAPHVSQVTLEASPLVATQEVATPSVPAAEFPQKVEIPAIDLSATIANPTTTDIEVLDAALLHGAVRYPTSAELGENGNVVLFGHSSYLPIVRNPAYKTFDGIQKLKPGDSITVYSSHIAYVYSVKSVAKESANDGVIPLAVAGKELTLATCDSFTKKTDRFVVVADFVESHSLGT